MSGIIALSDSNESVLFVDDNYSCKKNDEEKRESRRSSLSSDDFNFPEVQFYDITAENRVLLVPETNNVNSKDASSSEQNSQLANQENFLLVQNNDKESILSQKFPVHTLSDSYESDNDNNENIQIAKETSGTRVYKKSKNKLSDKKMMRQEQLAREKALKAIATKKSHNMKPGECMKYMEIVFDEGIRHFPFFNEITATLLSSDIRYSVDEQLIPNSVSWKRHMEESLLGDSNNVRTVINTQKENELLIIWKWDEVVTKIMDHSFCKSVMSIQSLSPDARVTLIIYGMQNYFANKQKGKKQPGKDFSKNKVDSTKNNSDFPNFPDISRKRLESCLAEIQIVNKYNSRLVDNPQDLANLIYQYTKAIAEIPYKLEKKKNIETDFEWYVMGDNRNTVRADKDGNGLKRLWQQQLCQFNLSSLEVAEAICTVYSSPVKLMEAYMNSSYDEGINLLKDIPIRRAAGPLTAIRRVGLELSKKIYTMFTSENGTDVLGDD